MLPISPIPSAVRPPAAPYAAPSPYRASSGAPTAALPEIDPVCLQQLPFPAFARTVADLLKSLGYRNVTLIKPMHARGKGRNAHGGLDIMAQVSTALTRGLVVVQLKQYKDAVPRAFVDELRGTMLRRGAIQGLLITTSTFSAAAVEAAQAAQHTAPVCLIEGKYLAALLHAQPEVPGQDPIQQTTQLLSPPFKSKGVRNTPPAAPHRQVSLDSPVPPVLISKGRAASPGHEPGAFLLNVTFNLALTQAETDAGGNQKAHGGETRGGTAAKRP